jgi:hypothetical protein
VALTATSSFISGVILVSAYIIYIEYDTLIFMNIRFLGRSPIHPQHSELLRLILNCGLIYNIYSM